MIDTNTDASDLSMVAKGRELLERGDISSAVECYGQAYDPDTVDESEARGMLIEARSHLSRRHLLEALECFEEALLMGTGRQRRQALEGISTVGEIRTGLGPVTAELKKGLKGVLGRKTLSAIGLSLVSDEENVLLISDEAAERLPAPLAKSARISRLPQHLADQQLPIRTGKCILFTDLEDIKYILEVVSLLVAGLPVERNGS